MKLDNVIVVYKRQTGGARGGEPRSPAASRFASLKRRHEAAIARIQRCLKRHGIACRMVERRNLKAPPRCDLIIAVGGDGTVISCAHAAGTTPVLGVCSMPGYSVGFFCGANAATFADAISKIAKGRVKPNRLPLIETRIGARTIWPPALNDVLFAGSSPAEMVRYTIDVGGKREAQRSSGIWIAAGPGSTAAIKSAGGRRQRIASPRLQYLVREPYPAPRKKYRLTKGFARGGGTISFISEMRDGTIYIDGPRLAYPVPLGARVECRISEQSLSIFL